MTWVETKTIIYQCVFHISIDRCRCPKSVLFLQVQCVMLVSQCMDAHPAAGKFMPNQQNTKGFVVFVLNAVWTAPGFITNTNNWKIGINEMISVTTKNEGKTAGSQGNRWEENLSEMHHGWGWGAWEGPGKMWHRAELWRIRTGKLGGRSTCMSGLRWDENPVSLESEQKPSEWCKD